MIEQIIKHN